jgi:hypothetical protein
MDRSDYRSGRVFLAVRQYNCSAVTYYLGVNEFEIGIKLFFGSCCKGTNCRNPLIGLNHNLHII